MISPTPGPGTFHSTKRKAWWVGPPLLLVIALYILPLAGSPPATNPNEVVRIELAASIAFWVRLDLGSAAEVYGVSEDVSIRDGEVYSDKAPGLSMVAAPAVWVVNPILERAPSSDLPAFWPLRHALTLLLVAMPTAGLAFLVGAAVPDSDPRHRSAYALIAALATPLWTYGTMFFGHASAALLVTLAWFLMLGFPGRLISLSTHRATLGGAVAGLAVTTEYPTVLLVAVIFVTLLVRRTTLPVLAGAAAGVFIGVLPALVYHQVAFGAPWITGYSFKAASDFQAIIAHGVFGISWPSLDALWGILFGASRGIFYYCPLLLLTPLGLWRMVQKRGWRDAGPILVGAVAYLFFATGFIDWPAGWCAAARHLVPIVPLLAIPVFYAVVNLGTGRWWNSLVAVLIAFSGVNAALCIALTPFFPPQFTSPLAQLVLPSLTDGVGLHNIVSGFFGLPPIYVVISIGAATIAALGWASSQVLRMPRRWVAAVFAATLATQLLWLSWQGANPSPEVEFMRAQVLRQLGHTEVADRIERSVMSDPTSAGK